MAMRMLNPQIRQPNNKESDWSGICDTVFDQFSTEDDVFGLSSHQRQSSSSDNSADLFDFSTVSSGQSNHTTGTSPDPSWAAHVAYTAAAIEAGSFHAQQPQAKESINYWQRKLKTLEHHAAESEEKERRLRASSSHPDFLSLGGHPSPAYAPCPVPDQSFSVPRSRPRESANGKNRSTSQIRSVSRGRPQGITKNNVATSNTQNATVRRRSVSPTKMMTPSRHRAGFRDVWADKLQTSPPKYALKLPGELLPESPPPSGQLSQHNFAAFGATTNTSAALLAAYDSELSPLTTTFQQARIHTPDASPFFPPVGQVQTNYINHNAFQPSGYTQVVPLNDTTPAYVDRSLAVNRIGSFDFGFSNPPSDTWTTTAAFEQPAMTHYHLPTQHDVFAGVEQHALNAVIDQPFTTGLGITCDGVYYPTTDVQDFAQLPPSIYHMQPVQPPRACYPPMPDGIPLTPHKQMPSRTPSPPMTEPRSRRASGVSLRRASKHRRAKSTTSIPRHVQNADKGGFVNFTPDDSNKILSGVAPSGSSKTKARREKEAAEKRRRLSQAAVKAVIDAGGDISSLTKSGLMLV